MSQHPDGNPRGERRWSFESLAIERLRGISLIVNTLLVLSVVGVVVAAGVTARDLFLIRDEVDRHAATVVRKGQLLSDLRAAIGYGGFIHNFKNYVLRQEEWRAQQVELDLRRVRTILKDYRAHGITDEEDQALDAVDHTIETYAERFAFARAGVKEGLSPGDLDHEIRVDDTPAIQGMEALQRVWNLGRSRHSRILNDAVTSGTNRLFAGGVALPIFFLVGGILVWFQRRLVHQMRENAKTVDVLARANALNRAVLDGVNVVIIATDPAGVLTVFNRSAELMLGYAAEEVIGTRTLEMLHDPDELRDRAKLLSEALDREVAPGLDAVLRPDLPPGGIDEGEWTAIDRHGNRFPILLSISPLHGHGGDLQGYVGIAVDITERRKTENIRREFVSTVSHELRTPLTSISGSLALVKEGVTGEVSPKAKELLGIAHANSLRLVRLVNDILDNERLESGRLEMVFADCDLMTLVDEAIAANAGYASECGVSLAVTARAETRVRGDGGRLLQVLANLLSNAAKFSPRGDTVEVAVTRTEHEVRVAVTDHGPGIAEKYRDRLFQPFFQIDSSDTRSKGGTGLGLSIVRAIVERHDGRIGFDSVPGTATTFHVTLPLSG